MPPHEFALVGGDAVLDFLNTIHDWTVPDPRDHLTDFPEALRFGAAAGLLGRDEVRRLRTGSGRRELQRLREVRAELERIFRAVATGRSPPAEGLDRLAVRSAEAAHGARLRPAGGKIVRAIEMQAAGAAILRWRIIDAAVALLTSPRLAQLGTCPGCGWFFLDLTKNRSRRWCSMAMCGNIAKSRSYYARSRRRRRPPRSIG